MQAGELRLERRQAGAGRLEPADPLVTLLDYAVPPPGAGDGPADLRAGGEPGADERLGELIRLVPARHRGGDQDALRHAQRRRLAVSAPRLPSSMGFTMVRQPLRNWIVRR